MKKHYILPILTAGLLFSCEVITSDTDVNKKEKVAIESPVLKDEILNPIVFAIPSPNEQIEILKYTNKKVKEDVVHDLAVADNYVTKDKKALNFGVYSTDAGYLTCFGNTSGFMKYMNTMENLGNDLGISAIYSDELMKQIEQFSDAPDSLFQLSSDNYLSVFDKLIENEKGDELSLILVGGWIETMHILFETAGDFNTNPENQSLILTQNVVLDNLMGYIETTSDNETVASLLKDLAEIKETFKSLDCGQEKTTVSHTEGKMIFDGGRECFFTEEIYNTLKNQITNLRTNITK